MYFESDEKDNITYLKEFIGTGWLDTEFKKINTKTPLKGAGAILGHYHPWIHYIYEKEYLIRRAENNNQNEYISGKYFHVLNNAGLLLKLNYSFIIDKKDAQKKLRNPEQFYDFIWELETRTMLSDSGITATFNNPKSGNTSDGTAIIYNRPICFECKNKVIENEQYNSNILFSQILTKRLQDVPSIKNKIIEIEYVNARLEDIKTIIQCINESLDKQDFIYVLGRYIIRNLKNLSLSTTSRSLMKRKGVNSVSQIEKRHKDELYNTNTDSKIVISKLVFKMPEVSKKLLNINNVLKKANSQLSSGGILFLQIPFKAFKHSKENIKRRLLYHFSNIYAVKIFAIKIEFEENVGVSITCLEDQVISKWGDNILDKNEKAFINQNLAQSMSKRR